MRKYGNEEVKNSLRTAMPARVEFLTYACRLSLYGLPIPHSPVQSTAGFRARLGTNSVGWSYDRPKAETSPLTGQGLEVVL